MAAGTVPPKTFFLNEVHQLTPEEKAGGGRTARIVGVLWKARAKQLSTSLTLATQKLDQSRDPLKASRGFLLATPVAEVEKESSDRRRAPDGTYKEPTDYSGTHCKVFDRLGLDLLQVTDAGKAVVHGTRETFGELQLRASDLDALGQREQNRWATLDSFSVVPVECRLDVEWWRTLPKDERSEAIIDLQPVLRRDDAVRVHRAVLQLLDREAGESIVAVGTDFSGRHWFRIEATRDAIRTIAKEFYSVQAVHPRFFSIAAARRKGTAQVSGGQRQPPSVATDLSRLPCVGIVDAGIPADHVVLSPYIRGRYTAASNGHVGFHGSFVASRAIFGDVDHPDALLTSEPSCTVYDINVAAVNVRSRVDLVDDKEVIAAMQTVRRIAPDVRVFNLSIQDPGTAGQQRWIESEQKRICTQDLDNFAFAHDCAIVVAAGNSPPNTPPATQYPMHFSDPLWALGHWASGFNTWACGAFVASPLPGGLVSNEGWPSPFSRVGPGVCGAPVPSFCASGGNLNLAYAYSPGHGVLGLSDQGFVEDLSGTSYSAPLLAREVALTLNTLSQFCAPGTQPFAITAKTFLTITAKRPTDDAAVRELAEKTLGYGIASRRRLLAPTSGSAVILSAC